jgi:hypothetical protein
MRLQRKLHNYALKFTVTSVPVKTKTNMTRMSQPTPCEFHPQHIRISVERGKEQDLQENEDCARQVESRHF